MVLAEQFLITSAEVFTNWRSTVGRCRQVLELERKCNAKRHGGW